jgi:hypothetical protein
LYGYSPRHLGLSPHVVGAAVLDLNEWLSEISLMQDLVRQHLLRAQARMKKQSDKNRSEGTF